MKTIIIRILKQMKNDKRSLVLLLFAPLLVLSLLYAILSESDSTLTIAAYQVPDQYISMLKEDATVHTLNKLPDKKDYMNDHHDTDAIVYFKDNKLQIYTLEKDSTATKVIKLLQPKDSNSIIKTEYAYKTGRNNMLDSMSYVFLGLLSFFFVYILSGMSFVSERFTQTLERMLMAPISRWKVITGYTIGYGILSTLQSILILLFSIYVLGVHIEGSLPLCMLIMFLMSFGAVLTGALVSIFVNNELQLVQFIPVVIIPQIFYSGLISIDNIPFGLDKLRFIMPSFYGCSGLKEVLTYGNGFMSVAPYLAGLLLFSLALFIINCLALKKYRRL